MGWCGTTCVFIYWATQVNLVLFICIQTFLIIGTHKLHPIDLFLSYREDYDFREDWEALANFYNASKLNNDFYLEDVANFAQLLAEEVSVR